MSKSNPNIILFVDDKLYPPIKEVLIIHQTVVLHQLQYLMVGLNPGQLA